MTRVCVGAIVGAQGIKGAVRIKSFTDCPADVGAYGPVEDESGQRRFKLKVTGESKGLVTASLEGVKDRDAAEALKGVRLYIPRSKLPDLDEDEFLYSDLVGLEARAEGGEVMGTVRGVADFGAGEVIDIVLQAGGSLMVPFTKAAVPDVDVRGGWLTVVPPVYAPDEKSEHAEAGDWAVEAPRGGSRAKAKQAERAPATEAREEDQELGDE